MFLCCLCSWPHDCCANTLTVNQWTTIISLLLIYRLYSGYLQTPASKKKKDVCRLHNVAAILLLQYMEHVMLFPTIKLLYCTSAFSAVCVQCLVWLFCWIPWYHTVLSRYVARVLSEWFRDGSSCPFHYCYHFVATFHMYCISVLRSSYFKMFLASFLITYLQKL